jgi:hypothetical protein
MDKWYLQRIPNNAKFSGVPKESSDEWVVLVGIKADSGEVSYISSPSRLCHLDPALFSCGTVQ